MKPVFAVQFGPEDPTVEPWSHDQLFALSFESPTHIVLEGMDAAQGHTTLPWALNFCNAAQESGIPLRWTVVSVVYDDTASARCVLDWAVSLTKTLDCVIVHNNCRQGAPSASNDPKIS